jgi:uncharacterized protein with HEPN domain
MPTRARKLLLDIRDCALAIQTYISGRTEQDLYSDRMLRRAVEREFEIIGEVANRLRHEAPQVASRLSKINEIVGFRNVLIHGYGIVDQERVWASATLALPDLIREVDSLLEDNPE